VAVRAITSLYVYAVMICVTPWLTHTQRESGEGKERERRRKRETAFD